MTNLSTTQTIAVVLLTGLFVTAGVGLVGASALGEDTAGTQGDIISIDQPESVEPGESFNVTVETTGTAGTIVEMDPDGFGVSLSTANDDAVRTNNTRVEFIDLTAGDSTYTIEVQTAEDAEGELEIATWTESETRSDADDEATATVTVGDSSDDNSSNDTDTPGAVESLEHPETIPSDGQFQVTVETVESAGTVVEIDPDGFDVELASDDAVRIDDGRAEFVDVNAGNSTYTLNVSVSGGKDGDTADIDAWVNGQTRTDAEDTASSTVTVEDSDRSNETAGQVRELDVPENATVDGEFNATVRTKNASQTVVSADPDGFNATLSSDAAATINGTTAVFDSAESGEAVHNVTINTSDGSPGDTTAVTAWVNSDNRDDADDEAEATVTLESADLDPAIELTHPETVSGDGNFTLDVETVESAGTIVEIDPTGFDVELSSDEAIVSESGRVEFADPTAGNSSYTIDVDVRGGSNGDTAEIAAWVNGQTVEDAEANTTAAVVIAGDDQEDDKNESDDGNESDEDIAAPPDEFTQFGFTARPGETTPESISGSIRTDPSVAESVSVELVRETEDEYTLDITAPDGTENVTFYLQSAAIESSQNIDNVTMYIDNEAQEFYLDADAGPGNSPWIAFRVDSFSTRTVTFSEDEPTEEPEIDVTGNGKPATDTTGDGKLDDIDGDGSFTIFDVQALFGNLDSDAVQDNPDQFDFTGSGDVSVFDVQTLFGEV